MCKTSLFHRFLLQIPLFKNQIRNIKEIHGKLRTPFWIIQAYKIKKQKVPSPTQDTIIHILTPLANLVNANFHKSSHQVLTMPAKTAQVFCLKYFCSTQQINGWRDVTACWTWLISCQNRKYVHQHSIIILWRHLQHQKLMWDVTKIRSLHWFIFLLLFMKPFVMNDFWGDPVHWLYQLLLRLLDVVVLAAHCCLTSCSMLDLTDGHHLWSHVGETEEILVDVIRWSRWWLVRVCHIHSTSRSRRSSSPGSLLISSRY